MIKGRLVLLISLSTLIFSAPNAEARLTCSSFFGSENSYKDYLRPVPENDFLIFMRSNPAASLAWFKEAIPKASPSLQSLSQNIGYIGGDIKADNVDIVQTKKENSLGLVDLDDGGVGPFTADLVHALVYNKIWPVSVPVRDALAAYKDGLHGDKLRGIVSLKLLLKKNGDKEFIREKLAKNKNKFFREMDLLPIEDSSLRAKSLYAKTEPLILKQLADYGDLIYAGVRVKSSGGSMTIPRYTFLLRGRKNHKLKVIEFKFQPDPAVTVLGSEQPSHFQRIQKLIEYYRPERDAGNILTVLKTPEGYFLVREHAERNFDTRELPKSKEELDEYQSYLLQMFHMIGSAHARQNPRYADEFKDHFHVLEPELESLVNEQVKQFRQDFVNLNKQSSASGGGEF